MVELSMIIPVYNVQEYIEKALSTITTGTAFIKKVTEMVEQKGVKINYHFHPFHPVVIEILKKYI